MVEHGLRHLTWVAADDPAISAGLPPAWRPVLAAYVPNPSGILDDDGRPPVTDLAEEPPPQTPQTRQPTLMTRCACGREMSRAQALAMAIPAEDPSR